MPNINIDGELWKAVKVRAANEGTSATNIVTQAVSSWMDIKDEMTKAKPMKIQQEVTTTKTKGPVQNSTTTANWPYEESGITVQGAQVKFAEPTPPLEDRQDIAPRAGYNTRPFTPVPKVAKKK